MSNYRATVPADAVDAVFAALTSRNAADDGSEYSGFARARTAVRNGQALDHNGWAWMLEAVRWAEQRAGDVATSKALNELHARLWNLMPAEEPGDGFDDENY